MTMIPGILFVFAFVLFIVGGFLNPPESIWKNRLVCLGLACWVLAEIVRGGRALFGS